MSLAVYNAIVADVYTITARPDLVAETALAVRKATMKYHMAELWVSDLAIAYPTLPVIPVGTDHSYRYTLDLTTVATYPRYRKLAYIKEYNNPLTGAEIQFKPLDMDRVLDGYQLEDINYYTQAGMSATVRASKGLTQLSVGYYKYPDVTPATFTSWISDQYQDAITEEAAAAIMRIIGKEAEAARLALSFAENMQLLRITQI